MCVEEFIYEQSMVKGAKRRQYGGVTGTKLSHIKSWRSDIFPSQDTKDLIILIPI
jgi:hypothetical protein